MTVFVTQGQVFWLCLVFKLPKFGKNTTDAMLSSNTLIKIRYIADMSVEKWTKIAPILSIRQLPNIVKSMSISLYFVRDILFGKLKMIAFSK